MDALLEKHAQSRYVPAHPGFDVENVSGICRITNTVSGKHYVGSTRRLKKRLYDHKNNLLRNKHPNKKLTASWNKHGADAFEFVVVETCDVTDLVEREQAVAELLDVFENGYNLRAVVACGRTGYVHSEESKQKMSASQKTWFASEEGRASMAARIPHKNTEDMRKNISKALKAKYAEPGSRVGTTLFQLGVKLGPWTPERIAKRTATRAANRLAKLETEGT